MADLKFNLEGKSLSVSFENEIYIISENGKYIASIQSKIQVDGEIKWVSKDLMDEVYIQKIGEVIEELQM